jgi:hypothetical protein
VPSKCFDGASVRAVGGPKKVLLPLMTWWERFLAEISTSGNGESSQNSSPSQDGFRGNIRDRKRVLMVQILFGASAVKARRWCECASVRAVLVPKKIRHQEKLFGPTRCSSQNSFRGNIRDHQRRVLMVRICVRCECHQSASIDIGER